MKHIKYFKELIESTSAGSQETNNIMPFKYSKVYDPRIGYNKQEFFDDLGIIMKELDDTNKKNLLTIIKSMTGEGSIDSVLNIQSRILNDLMDKVEKFLDSKADFQLNMYPDGYVLCFEDIRRDGKKYDLYFNPTNNRIKIVSQTGAALEPENYFSLADFMPKKYNIDENDFSSTIEKTKSLFAKKETSDSN